MTIDMDYLQLDFDGNRFTLNVWPIITVEGKDYKFGEPSYRESLCSLIAQVVKRAIGVEKHHFTITFESGDNLIVSLDPNNPELLASEIAIFMDANEKWYVFD